MISPELILGIIQTLATESPEIMESLKRLFTKADPKPSDWQTERMRIQDMYYDQLVPAGALLHPPVTT